MLSYTNFFQLSLVGKVMYRCCLKSFLEFVRDRDIKKTVPGEWDAFSWNSVADFRSSPHGLLVSTASFVYLLCENHRLKPILKLSIMRHVSHFLFLNKRDAECIIEMCMISYIKC
jgi:hypothetical protein